MTKQDLVEKITKILRADGDLDFLFKLAPRELEVLVVCLRDLEDGRPRCSNVVGIS
jgi:hypothetical protein